MADIAYTPIELNFEHYEGDDFLWETIYKTGATADTAVAVDFTGWSGAAQVVPAKDEAAVALPLTVQLGTGGLIRVSGLAETFTDITSDGKRWKGVWDLRLTDTLGFRKTYFSGRFVIVPRAK